MAKKILIINMGSEYFAIVKERVFFIWWPTIDYAMGNMPYCEEFKALQIKHKVPDNKVKFFLT